MSEVLAIIEEMNYQDTYEASLMHCASFDKKVDILASLGDEFLHEMYDAMLDSEHCFAYSVYDVKRVFLLGYAVVSYDRSKIMNSISFWRQYRLVSSMLWKLLVNPFLIFKIKNIVSGKGGDTSIKPELLVICVDKKLRHKGIGTMLIKQVERQLLRKDYKKYYVYVNRSNFEANLFYSKNDFIMLQEVKFNNKVMNLWKKYL